MSISADHRASASSRPVGCGLQSWQPLSGAESAEVFDPRPEVGRILVVDDNSGVRRLLELGLSAAGHSVRVAAGSEQALGKISAQLPDLVITERRLDGLDGLGLINHIRSRGFTMPIIVLTAECTVPEAVQLIRAGAFGVLQKSCDSRSLLDEVASAMALAGRRVRSASEDSDWCPELVTRSPRMDALLQRAACVARTDAPVLLQGESGTGKQVLARAIHGASPRAAGPFVALRCAVLPPEQLEQEILCLQGVGTNGHGGLVRSASGGTLLLDNISAMPMRSQIGLLRALESRVQNMPGDGGASGLANVRILSTTADNLEVAVAEGVFRRDLAYCLQTVMLEVPCLRERVEDVALLAGHFLDSVSDGLGTARTFSAEAVRLLQQASWPGNVRQLRNVVEHVHALCSGPVIGEELVARALRGDYRSFAPLTEACAEFKRDYLSMLLRAVSANVTEAARIAGRNRTQFYRLLHRHHLDQRDFRQ